MIALGHIRPSDYRSMKSYVTDPKVSQFLTWKPYNDEKKIKDFFNTSTSLNEYPNEFLGIYFKNKMIGTVHLIERENKMVQFGFGILPCFWGNDFGSMIVKQTILYLKKGLWFLRVKTIVADVHKKNIFSIRVLEENGFIKIDKNPKKLGDRMRYIYSL